MSTSKTGSAPSITSDQLHNKNCFNYLCKLDIPEFLRDRLAKFPVFPKEYDSDYAYGDLYTTFFNLIDKNIDEIYLEPEMNFNKMKLVQAQIDNYPIIKEKISDEQKRFMELRYKAILGKKNDLELNTAVEKMNDLDRFIISIYVNDNEILSSSFDAIKHIPRRHTPSSQKIKESITDHTEDKGQSINKTTSPAKAGSAVGRLSALLDSNFKPQHTTSLATVRKYRHTNIAEYRFGTQAQRHEGKVRISPLFVHFLKAQDRKRNYDTKITQLYINNLGRDRADFEGKKEVEATQALEDLEKDHSNIAVITLPADKGLLDRHAFASTQPSLVAEVVKDKFLNIASQNGPAGEKYKDFYISDRIRTLIFKNKDGGYDKISQETELLSLINESFVALKLDKTSLLSKAQEQAIWFHFVKFVLTDRIITSLNPGAINFSCKDAIDRGAASSAYYNLIKSFSTRAPLTRDEFDCALHAAATMVKGRGMNHHLNLVWNAVDAYVDANYNLIHNDDDKKWLIEWRDCNCPHERVLQLLKHRANQLYDELNDANVNQKFKICKALEILESIKTQSVTGLSGKRLLLEAAVRTPGIALGTCTEADIESYGKLADKLMINYPTLHIIGGLMKVLAGIALYIVSLSLAKKTSNKLFDSGLATAKAGYHACTRTGLQSLMKEQLETIKNEDKPKDSQPEGQLDEGGLSP